MKNVEKLKETIRNDANLTMKYFGEDGTACVIGGLAESCGFDRNKFDEPAFLSEWINEFPGYEPLVEMIDLIKAEYDLTVDQMYRLQKINDMNIETEKRREALLRAVDVMQLED